MSKVLNKKPPHYWFLVKIFGFDWERNIATFGDSIYCAFDLPDHLIVHEETHLKQQRYSNLYAIWWWVKYVFSKKFRYSQELEAYRNQWKFFEKHYRFNEHRFFLHKIASDLSSKLYGNIVSYEEARQAIYEK